MTSFTEAPKDIQECKERIIKLLQEGWCKQAAALDEKGVTTSTTGSEARKLCLVGAVIRANIVFGGNFHYEISHMIMARIKKHGFVSLSSFNDDPKTTLEDIIIIVKTA